ncbi:peptidase A24A, prepilin type IV [Rhodococcus triatomae BKS 15-14]|nr:peptidase A24A, prepilin type IV [Rhodococcus triatomae BKS 15-14]
MIDLRSRRLPNVLTLPGAVVILLVAAGAGQLRPALVGAGLLAGGYLLVHLAAPAAMGAGDVKLALGLGAVTGTAGASAWLLGAAGAFVVTAVAGSVLRVAGRGAASLPHGPSMCVATLVALATVSV